MIRKIYNKEDVIKVLPDDNLSHVVSLLSTSHDAAFVVDKDEKFLGIINPYYCVIKKSYPANTKAKHCLFHPPHIDVKTPLERVIRLMIETKVHYLPVFENKKFIGVISARGILGAIVDEKKLAKSVGDIVVKKKALISLYEDDFISRAMTLFKQHKISKLIVVSRDLKLRGVLAYYDLIAYLTKPNEGTRVRAMVGNKVPKLERAKVRNFMKTQLLTIGPRDTLSKATDLILERRIGSVIVTDAHDNPIGLITTTDVLSAYVGKREIPIVHLVGKNLTEGSAALAKTFMTQMNKMLRNRQDVSKVELTVKEKKGAGIFEAMLSILSMGKKPRLIHEEGKNLEKVLKDVKKKAKSVKSKKSAKRRK